MKPCRSRNCIEHKLRMTDVFLSSVSKMLQLCGDSEEKLAQELLIFEIQIERDVVEPLYVLAEVSMFSQSYLASTRPIS